MKPANPSKVVIVPRPPEKGGEKDPNENPSAPATAEEIQPEEVGAEECQPTEIVNSEKK